MRILLDTNIVLDVIAERQPFVIESKQVWQLCERGICSGFISAITPLNLVYILRKQKSKAEIVTILENIFTLFDVCTIDKGLLSLAVNSPFNDYEDAVQYVCAVNYQLDAIITRDPSGFAQFNFPTFSPSRFLQQFKNKK